LTSADAILKVTTEVLRHSVAGRVPFYPVQDGDFHREGPAAAVRAGRVAKVPAIIGNVVQSRGKKNVGMTKVTR
jgi:hypothetical protein